jgi:hypothetical protein
MRHADRRECNLDSCRVIRVFVMYYTRNKRKNSSCCCGVGDGGGGGRRRLNLLWIILPEME